MDGATPSAIYMTEKRCCLSELDTIGGYLLRTTHQRGWLLPSNSKNYSKLDASGPLTPRRRLGALTAHVVVLPPDDFHLFLGLSTGVNIPVYLLLGIVSIF